MHKVDCAQCVILELLEQRIRDKEKIIKQLEKQIDDKNQLIKFFLN